MRTEDLTSHASHTLAVAPQPKARKGGRRTSIVFAVMQTGRGADGGVESVTQVIEGLSGYDVTVVTQMETPMNGRWRAAGARVLIWPIPYRLGSSFRSSTAREKFQRLGSIARSNWQFSRLLRAVGCTIVHLNDLGAFQHFAYGAKLAGARIVFNLRDTKPNKRYDSRWIHAMRSSDVVVALSREMGAELAEAARLNDSHVSRLEAVYSAVDFELAEAAGSRARADLRRQLGIPDGVRAVGYVGVISPKKGQLEFLHNAATRILESAEETRIYFIGDTDAVCPSYWQDCRNAVRAMGLQDSVVFTGYQANVFEWYQALDVTVLASQNEGLARAMIESLTCGTPVVSFDVCSAAEILEGHRCGLVASQGNYEQLAAHVIDILDDASIREILGANGKRSARALFDPRRCVQRYDAIYRSLLGGGTG